MLISLDVYLLTLESEFDIVNCIGFIGVGLFLDGGLVVFVLRPVHWVGAVSVVFGVGGEACMKDAWN